ncbi:MAG: hypothetical protein MUC36_06320 [Planctomycetes bacterium]|nr:hypothetical protein [Planctomycetota bacterium]
MNASPSPRSPAHHVRMEAVRCAFRSRRLAHEQSRLFGFYIEHNLLDEACRCREQVLEHLRFARRQWQTVLGLNL